METDAKTSRKRKALTLEERVSVVKRSRGGESAIRIAISLGVGKTQIQGIVKDQENVIKRWESGESADRKSKIRECPYNEINQKVWDFMCDARARNIPVNGRMLQEKAIFFSVELGLDNFCASNGWLDRWRARYMHSSYAAFSGKSGGLEEELCKSREEGISKKTMSNKTPTEQLISAVKKQEILYNNTCLDQNLIDSAWAAVAKETGQDVNSCQKQWYRIEGTYRHIIRQQISSNGSLPVKKPRWHLYHHMSFLKKHLPLPHKIPETDLSLQQSLTESQDRVETCILDEASGVLKALEYEQLDLGVTEESWDPLSAVGNSEQDEMKPEETGFSGNTILQATTHDPSTSSEVLINEPVLSATNNESIVTIELPPHMTQPPPPLQNENKRKRPASTSFVQEEDPVQLAFLNLIKDKRKKLAQPVPVADPELQIFRGLVPFIQQLTEKNKRRFVSKTTSLLMELLNFQDHDQRLLK